MTRYPDRLKREVERQRVERIGNILLVIGAVTCILGLAGMWIDLGAGVFTAVIGFALAVVGEEMTR